MRSKQSSPYKKEFSWWGSWGESWGNLFALKISSWGGRTLLLSEFFSSPRIFHPPPTFPRPEHKQRMDLTSLKILSLDHGALSRTFPIQNSLANRSHTHQTLPRWSLENRGKVAKNPIFYHPHTLFGLPLSTQRVFIIKKIHLPDRVLNS